MRSATTAENIIAATARGLLESEGRAMLADDVPHTTGNTPYRRIQRPFGSAHDASSENERLHRSDWITP